MINHETKNMYDKKSKNIIAKEVASRSNFKEECMHLEAESKNEIKEVQVDDCANDDIMLIEDTVVKQIKIDKNLVLRVIENSNGKFIDLRRFYKNYPTKKGIRINYAVYKKVNSLID